MELNIVAAYALLYNAARLVKNGVGVAICLDGIANASYAGDLVFRPFKPELKAALTFAWKKAAALSPAASVYLKNLKDLLAEEKET